MHEHVEFRYLREDDHIRITARGDPNEVRVVLLGVWADWSAEARIEFISELAHYAVLLDHPEAVPERRLPQLALIVRDALRKEVAPGVWGIDIDALKRQEHGEESPRND